VVAFRMPSVRGGVKETTNIRHRKTITKDEGVMLSKPIVAGTRLTVELILEKLAAGESVGPLVESYPRLDHESVREALLFAAGRVEDVLTRLELSEESLADALTALDDHSEGTRGSKPCPGTTSPTKSSRRPCWPSRRRSWRRTSPKNGRCRPWRSSRARMSRTSFLGTPGRSLE
jgi:uncharacterized protein (DUF433 family)